MNNLEEAEKLGVETPMEAGPGNDKVQNDDIEMESKYETDTKLKNLPEIVVEKSDTQKALDNSLAAPKTADDEAREMQLEIES